MKRRCAKWMIAVAVLCQACAEGAQEHDTWGDSVIRLLSPDLRRTEKRLGEIEKEVKSLPEVLERPWGSRYGHRSGALPDEKTEDWLQLDLGEQRTVDRVVLMPSHLDYLGAKGEGYGFPKRFRVEISDHADMRDAVVLVDRSRADVVNPGKYPLVFEVTPTSGRYVRMTSLKHCLNEGIYFWALEEIMVLEGNMNVAASKSDNLTHSSNLSLFPQWVPIRVVDGQGGMGMPVDVTSPSPTQGYMSARLSMKEYVDPLPENAWKWCVIDLGDSEAIEQVRLLPLESEEYEVVQGRGFPRQMVLQLSNDPGFNEVIWESGERGFALGYPAGCSVNIFIPKTKARYVRLLVSGMWSRDAFYIFGLAEMQVYGSNRNLALGKPVSVKDQADKPNDPRWAPAHLVDGYTSRYRLIEWPEYLGLLNKRGQLEREKHSLVSKRLATLKTGRKLLVGSGALLAVSALTGWIWVSLRQRVLIKREAEQLRQQIARDLHDDIGSNLGGIVLLSEIGSQHSTDEESRSDFESIRAAAEEASSSMRDIVWLIQRDSVGLKEFITRMRQSLHMILKHLDVSIDVVPEAFRDKELSLLFRRHVFLAFKEVLNNVRKHAHTSQVTVKVVIEPSLFRFIVRDHGIGFDPQSTTPSGHGLGNLKRRAERMSGRVDIDSRAGEGTTVTFEVPFH